MLLLTPASCQDPVNSGADWTMDSPYIKPSIPWTKLHRGNHYKGSATILDLVRDLHIHTASRVRIGDKFSPVVATMPTAQGLLGLCTDLTSSAVQSTDSFRDRVQAQVHTHSGDRAVHEAKLFESFWNITFFIFC